MSVPELNLVFVDSPADQVFALAATYASHVTVDRARPTDPTPRQPIAALAEIEGRGMPLDTPTLRAYALALRHECHNDGAYALTLLTRYAAAVTGQTHAPDLLDVAAHVHGQAHHHTDGRLLGALNDVTMQHPTLPLYALAAAPTTPAPTATAPKPA